MHTETQILALFGLPREPRNPGAWDQFADIWDWEPLGFPGVYSTVLFLPVRGRQRWLEHVTLAFPDNCCRCEAPSTTAVDFHHFLRVPFLRIRSGRAYVRAIPHCKEHARRDPLAFARVFDEDTPFIHAQLFALHRPFLERCIALNRLDGEPPPPWVAFPHADPFRGFRQGTNEYWMQQAWGPFWFNLASSERESYLQRHAAPPAWRERLALHPRL